jgi:hypothetical protein
MLQSLRWPHPNLVVAGRTRRTAADMPPMSGAFFQSDKRARRKARSACSEARRQFRGLSVRLSFGRSRRVL